jgi:hypothetical protein
MRRVRIYRVLLPGLQMNLMPHSIKIFRPRRRATSRRSSPLPWHVKRNAPPSAAKSFFLARHSTNRRVPMLRTSLPRNHHQFLRAHPLRIHISKNLQSALRQLAQPKIRHFHPLLLFRSDQDPRVPQQFHGRQRNFVVPQSALASSLYNIAARGVSVLQSRNRNCRCANCRAGRDSRHGSSIASYAVRTYRPGVRARASGIFIARRRPAAKNRRSWSARPARTSQAATRTAYAAPSVSAHTYFRGDNSCRSSNRRSHAASRTTLIGTTTASHSTPR